MMNKVVITAFALSIATVAPLVAQSPPCQNKQVPKVTGKLDSPQAYTVSWEAVPGAYAYVVDELRPTSPVEKVLNRQLYTNRTSIDITHESINDVTYQYRIQAIGGLYCHMYSPHVKTFGDPVLRARVRRGIVPIVGSARGANGAVFKTYLKLEGANLKGRIIFHPAGRVASDDDPSIPYDTTTRQEWDDVVAAMGQSGTGSLSIVPAEGDVAQIPQAIVRLYNVAAAGVFGAGSDVYPAVDFVAADASFQRVVVPADGNFRANVGVRAILYSSVRGVAVTKEGLEKEAFERVFEPGEVVFGSPEAVYGVSMEPGESLLLTFTRGVVPFYTLTDNRTNDPFLYVQASSARPWSTST